MLGFDALGVLALGQVPDGVGEANWHQGWSNPQQMQRLGLASKRQQFLAFVQAPPFNETVTEDRWHQPWSEPRWGKRWPLIAASGWYGSLGAGVAEIIYEDKWHFAWSEPIVKNKIGLRPGSQQALIWSGFTPIKIDWFMELSKPQKLQKPGIDKALQQYIALHANPIIDISWFMELSKPRTLQKRGLPTTEQLPFTFNPLPLVSFGWFGNLSEPKRFKRGLATPLHPFITQDPTFIPNPATIIEGWYGWLAEPKRFLKGPKVQYQPDYTAPPRHLPTPNILVTLDATETNSDAALMAINVVIFNTPASAKVSLTEIGGGSATSIIES